MTCSYFTGTERHMTIPNFQVTEEVQAKFSQKQLVIYLTHTHSKVPKYISIKASQQHMTMKQFVFINIIAT